MSKDLSEMSLEELWQLFPIVLTEHNKQWKDWFLQESLLLKTALPNEARISHIGSTYIPTIWAKPIIDILIELPTEYNLNDYKKTIISKGYICMSEKENIISFNKGYTNHGFDKKVFHVHLKYKGDNDELYFKDYLIDHPTIAKDYENLKLELWKKFKHNRDAYTEAKSKFVKKHTTEAKILYKNKYE